MTARQAGASRGNVQAVAHTRSNAARAETGRCAPRVAVALLWGKLRTADQHKIRITKIRITRSPQFQGNFVMMNIDIEVGAVVSTRMRSLLAAGLGQVRHEPTAKRIRGVLGGATVLDSTRAMLVWEPRRVVPSYAVPVADVRGELVSAGAAAADAMADVGFRIPDIYSRPVLDPSIPFTVHTAEGRVVDLVAGGQNRPGAGFCLADEDLARYVVLDFSAFDSWCEEDEVNVAHPRNRFHRIDVLSATRQVRLELDGQVLAQSSRPTLLFETMLPTRYYLPHEDIRAELISSSARTYCAYKGQSSYWSAVPGGRQLADIAWTYENPLHDAAQVRGLVAFFDERIDVIVDGERLERPVTPWSAGPPR